MRRFWETGSMAPSLPPATVINALPKASYMGPSSCAQRQVFNVDQFTAAEPGSFTRALSVDHNAEMVGVCGTGFLLMGNSGAWEINRKRQNIKIS